MSSRAGGQSEQQQFDMDSLFDFSQGTSQQSPITGHTSPFGREERPQFNGPSHDYSQFKQQVGVPLAHMAGMPQAHMNSSTIDGFNSGFGEMDFNSGYGYNSGLEFDSDMTMDFGAPQTVAPMFFPNVPTSAADAQADFVNPTNLVGQDESASSVGRLWPGMHSQQAQQAALAKAAHTQAAQQRQIKLQNQQAQLRQASKMAPSPSSQASSQQPQPQPQPTVKRASHVVDPVVEESISRLLNQMRQNGGSSSADHDDPDFLPNLARMKKDEEDMDEDERLLASEEGKKLSSKERRQLRNKVSARAFRSRRKEYITQLEGEVALRTQENNALRAENQSVMQENERYRHLIETLLQHPAYRPFINDISNDPSLLGVPQQHIQQQSQQAQSQSQSSVAAPSQASLPTQPPQQQEQQQQPQQDMKPEFLNFDASQLQIPTPQPGDQAPHVNMATMPETDFSKLNINGFKTSQGVNFNNYSVGAYVVTGIPPGPCPLESLMDAPARLPSCLVSDDVFATSHDAAPDADLTVLLAKLDRASQRLDAVRPSSASA